MNRYYIYNRKRKKYYIVESPEILVVGQVVLMRFDNKDFDDGLYECEIVEVMKGLEC